MNQYFFSKKLKNKNGFTLVELLAVLVILAAIMLIVSPVVLNVIDNSENKTGIINAELYKDAVDLAIYHARLNGKKILSDKCEILSNGNICLEKENGTCIDELKVKAKGNMPISGTIEFEGSVIKKVYLEFEDDVIIKSDINGDLIIVDPNEIDPNATDPSCFEYAFNYEYKVDYDACDEFIAEKNESEENSNSGSVFGDMSCREAELYLGMDLKNIFSLMVNDSMIYEEMLNEGIVEEVKKDTIAITNYICGGVEGAEGVIRNVVIPKRLDGKTVTAIGPGAFYMNDLEVIEIPNRVKIIGFLAFAGGKEKKLKSVTIYKNKDDIENLFVPDNNFLRTFEWIDGYNDTNIIWIDPLV